MTPAERARMRDAIAKAIKGGLFPGSEPEHPGPMPLTPAPAPADAIDRFRAALTALGGTVTETSSANAAIAALLQIVEAQPAKTVLMWDEAELPVPGVAAALERAGATILKQSPRDFEQQDTDPSRSAERRAAFGSATVGITGAQAAIVQTGSIVVVSGPGRGRLASLLPPVHIALVPRAVFAESLAHCLAARPDLVTAGANFVCITGPSRTADIENMLTRGVHGPREVHVIVVE